MPAELTRALPRAPKVCALVQAAPQIDYFVPISQPEVPGIFLASWAHSLVTTLTVVQVGMAV
jgi:hypothetical protein